jgi:hypothetical protein
MDPKNNKGLEFELTFPAVNNCSVLSGNSCFPPFLLPNSDNPHQKYLFSGDSPPDKAWSGVITPFQSCKLDMYSTSLTKQLQSKSDRVLIKLKPEVKCQL